MNDWVSLLRGQTATGLLRIFFRIDTEEQMSFSTRDSGSLAPVDQLRWVVSICVPELEFQVSKLKYERSALLTSFGKCMKQGGTALNENNWPDKITDSSLNRNCKNKLEALDWAIVVILVFPSTPPNPR